MLVRIHQLIPVQASKDESIGTEKLSWDISKSEFERTSFHCRQIKRNRLLTDSQKKLRILAHVPFLHLSFTKGPGDKAKRYHENSFMGISKPLKCTINSKMA